MGRKMTVLKYAVVCALLILSFPSHADDRETERKPQNKFYDMFGVNFNLGNASFGGLFPIVKGDNVYEFTVEVLPIGFEHLDTRLGIWFSPLNFFYMNQAENESQRLSIINMGLYWDALPGGEGMVYAGPFASASYRFLDNGAHWDRYTFTAGLRGGLRFDTDYIRYPLISAETGVRVIDGNANVFLAVKLDFLPLLVIGVIAAGSSGSDDDD
jgi:hypothetical protein